MPEIKPTFIKGEPVCSTDCLHGVPRNEMGAVCILCRITGKDTIMGTPCIPGLCQQRDKALDLLDEFWSHNAIRDLAGDDNWPDGKDWLSKVEDLLEAAQVEKEST